jgi:hypothetical protein
LGVARKVVRPVSAKAALTLGAKRAAQFGE